MTAVSLKDLDFYQPLFEDLKEVMDITKFSKFYYFSDEGDDGEDDIVNIISDLIITHRESSYTALKGSLETENFHFTYLLYDNEDKFISYDVDKKNNLTGILIAIK